VFGAGAIGGALAARLAMAPALAATRISVVARGAHGDAIRKNGIRLWSAGEDQPLVANVAASEKAADLGPQDLVVTTLKGHQLPAAARELAALLEPATRIVMVQNGIPWWYFHADSASGLEGERIGELDPEGLLWDLVGPRRIIGAVAYQAAEVIAPGEIRLTGGGRLVVGEPSGAMSGDLEIAGAALEASGWQIVRSPRIRDEIWRKLIGNAAFNPISALTRARLTNMIEDPVLVAIIRQAMDEVIAVGASLGAKVEMTAEQRINEARRLGPVRSSMLQDLEAGRSMEIGPLVQAVALLGDRVNVPTPVLDVVFGLINRLDHSVRTGASRGL
jgi:2-dehydropantoate 2-reductase